MAIVFDSDAGTITGISVGGLPDGVVDAGTLATNSVDSAELIDGAVDDSHMAAMAASKLTGALPAISGASLTGLTGNVAGGSFSRNIATVGTLALTGFGFTPKAIHFSYGNQYSGLNVGFGWQWAVNSYNVAITSPWTATGNWNIEPSNGYPITFFSGSGSNGNRTDGKVTSFDSDGVTITFSTPVGSPSGTMRVIYTAWG